MGVEHQSSCGYDFFQIAWPNVEADLIDSTGKFCGFVDSYEGTTEWGNEFPADGITIPSSEFQFRWQTDYSVIYDGVELEWTCSGGHNQKIPKVDPCDLRKAFKHNLCYINHKKNINP